MCVQAVHGLPDVVDDDIDGDGTANATDTSPGGTADREASYVYTADGSRLIRREGATTTVYLPGGQELTATRSGSSTTVTATRYYAFNGTTVAARTADGAAGVNTLVSDPHGTAQITISGSTNQVNRRYLDPYGRPIGDAGGWPGDHGFLDKPTDSTGLTQVGARYYDSTTARFVSVDPVMDPTDPQQWHGYAYASNNPVTNSDPSGLRPQEHDDAGRPSAPYTPGYTPLPAGSGRHTGPGRARRARSTHRMRRPGRRTREGTGRL